MTGTITSIDAGRLCSRFRQVELCKCVEFIHYVRALPTFMTARLLLNNHAFDRDIVHACRSNSVEGIVAVDLLNVADKN